MTRMAAARRSRRPPASAPAKAPMPHEVLGAVAERFRVLGTESRLRIVNALISERLVMAASPRAGCAWARKSSPSPPPVGSISWN